MVNNVEKLKLKNHPYSNCYVLKDFEDEKIVAVHFISYTTEVITAVKSENYWLVKCHGTFSQTTAKQIGYFLKEYFPELNYYDMKNSFKKNEVISYTGKSFT